MKEHEALTALEQEKKLKKWLETRGPELLRRMRARSGKGVVAFADSLGISATFVSLCEGGHKPLSKPLAEKLLKRYLKPMRMPRKEAE